MNRLVDVDCETFSISAARNGNGQAWRELFERHFDPVYRFCIVLAEGRRDLAEEVAHQVFVVAARRIHRFDCGRASFRAWLLGIAKNRHAATRGDECRRKRHEEGLAQRESKGIAPPGGELQVHEALARLPSRYRAVLEAKYLQGLSMKDIAADGGVSIEAVESLLRRARASFAHAYEQIRCANDALG